MKLVFPMVLVSLVACGGSTTTDLFNDASTGNDSGNGGNDSGSGNDAGQGKDSSVVDARPDAPTPTCQDLLTAIAAAQEKAVKCNSGDPNQCGTIVSGMCCPISVTDPTSGDVKDFVAAVDAAKKAGCQTPCPPCAFPQKICNKNTGRCL